MKWRVDVSQEYETTVVIETEGDVWPSRDDMAAACALLRASDWDAGIRVFDVIAATAADDLYECYQAPSCAPEKPPTPLTAKEQPCPPEL